MAESSAGERTEKATPKKRKDARERGQVRKSQDMVTAISLLIMLGALKLLMWSMGKQISELSVGYFDGTYFVDGQLSEETAKVAIAHIAISFILIMLPLWAIAMVGGILGNVVQFGFLFSTKSLAVKMSRLNPLKGLARMFSFRTLFDLVKNSVRLGIIGFIIYRSIFDYMDEYSTMMVSGLGATVIHMGEMIFDLAFKIALVIFIMAVVDFAYQWYKYEKDLKMTKYEVKMEYKQQEGDPQIKGAIKQKQRQMAAQRMMQSVPEADVVVTNPTHYAVALKYDEAVSPAPMVLAKGKDYVAQKIKEVAGEHQVTIIENKEVARALYSYCEIGDQIPLDMYAAVATILAQVFKLRKEGYHR